MRIDKLIIEKTVHVVCAVLFTVLAVLSLAAFVIFPFLCR